MIRKVCVVTGTRAEYGLFYPVMKKIQSSRTLRLQLVVTTMHLSDEFGNTYRQIEEEGFEIDEKIENLLSADTRSAVAKSTGLATVLLSDAFNRLQPDIVLILGDRFEAHATATAAMLMNIPLAHIHGGEITEGAVDEQIRHSITKMSHLHFTATEAYRQRVIQMGEDPARVFCSGAPGIDNMMHMKLLGKHELEKELGWSFGSPTALFTYHPGTLDQSSAALDIDDILHSISASGLSVLFTYANADCGGRVINQKIEAFCELDPVKYKVVKSLGQLRYLSAMKYVDLLVGNSSSAIVEAASFHKPVVNIGDRQKGRLQSGNVIDCDIKGVSRAVCAALAMPVKKQVNIYGTGEASDLIVGVLERVDLSVVKKFVDKV